MLRKLFAIVFLLTSSVGFSQEAVWSQFSEDSIRQYVYTLASDSLEGRETGRAGQKKAASYIIDHYRKWNIGPGVGGYLLNHPINKRFNPKHAYQVGEKRYSYYDDFFYYPQKDTTLFIPKVCFLGNAAKKISGDFSSTTLIIADPDNDFIKKQLRIKRGFSLSTQLENVKSSNPALVTILTTNLAERMKFLGDTLKLFSSRYSFPVMLIDTAILSSLDSNLFDSPRKRLGQLTELQQIIGISQDTSLLTGQNILAEITGTDDKGEYIVLSAHYDHLGIHDKEIHPGADDNASGTSVLMEFSRIIATASQTGIRPKKNILFVNFSGEEKGLLGSSWFVNHPPIPENKILADINIDMVGRFDEHHAENQKYIYLIGSADKLSQPLYEKVLSLNTACCGLDVDQSLDGEAAPGQYYRRSDHYNFIKKGIPAVFFFSGVHEDYHKPGDTADKIRYDLMKERSKLFFYLLWDLAF